MPDITGKGFLTAVCARGFLQQSGQGVSYSSLGKGFLTAVWARGFLQQSGQGVSGGSEAFHVLVPLLSPLPVIRIVH